MVVGKACSVPKSVGTKDCRVFGGYTLERPRSHGGAQSTQSLGPNDSNDNELVERTFHSSRSPEVQKFMDSHCTQPFYVQI